jgi:hypothetical protein
MTCFQRAAAAQECRFFRRSRRHGIVAADRVLEDATTDLGRQLVEWRLWRVCDRCRLCGACRIGESKAPGLAVLRSGDPLLSLGEQDDDDDDDDLEGLEGGSELLHGGSAVWLRCCKQFEASTLLVW